MMLNKAKEKNDTQKDFFENKIKEMVLQHHDDKMETTKHYMGQMDLIKLEIECGMQVKNSLIDKSNKLMDELTLLTKVIKSNRAHFKQIEKADFNELQRQMDQYEKKLSEICDSEDFNFNKKAYQSIRAAKYIMKN